MLWFKKIFKILFVVATLVAIIALFIFLRIPSPNYKKPVAVTANMNTVADNRLATRAENMDEIADVVRVVDGDTIEVSLNGRLEKVRYIGINAPESVDPRVAVQCFGIESSEENKKLVEGKTVRLEKDIGDRDKYGRLLRYVWVGETMINEKLVALGFAKVSTYPPDVKYADQFLSAERSARATSLGLWSGCPIKK